MDFACWAARVFVKEANEYGHKQQLLNAVKNDTDSDWTRRTSEVMENLRMNFVMETGDGMLVYDASEQALAVLKNPKEILVEELNNRPAQSEPA